MPERATSCDHDDAPRSHYTGTLCSPCYREIEIRIKGLAGYCSALRRMAAPSTVAAVKLEERVQTSKEHQLPIDEHLLTLADDLYLAATAAVIASADLINTEPPYALADATAPMRYRDNRVTSFAAMSVEAWLARNLQWIAAIEWAWRILEPLLEALTAARRAVDPAPPRKPALRGSCSVCLGRVNIEIRARGVFWSSCGGCGKRNQIHATVVEAVLRGHDDGDGSGTSDRPDQDDPVEVSSSGPAALAAAGA